MSVALQFHGVVKSYDRLRALDGLDLEVPQGSIFGLVGSNGAGKTTAMAIAVGLLRAGEGAIDVLGDGPFTPEHHAGRVALLPQDSQFPPHGRVEDLLRFYGRIQGLPSTDIAPAIDTLLNWVHLQDRRRSPVRALSHGMKRRLAIAQAFLGTPELVLLDEPLNGLDPKEAARVRDLIRERRGHQTIVISSHQLTDIEVLCDHVAFVEKGKRVRQDTLDKIVRRSHCVTYHIGRGALPLTRLAAELPDITWEQHGNRVVASFPSCYTAEALNTAALRIFLAAGVGILEIRRGSDLESEYLKLSADPPPLQPPPVP